MSRKVLHVPEYFTLQDLIDKLRADPALQLSAPSIGAAGRALYHEKPSPLHPVTVGNLDKPLLELIEDSEEIVINDPIFPKHVSILMQVRFDA